MGIVCFTIQSFNEKGEVVCTSLWNSEDEHSTTETYIDDIEMVVEQHRDIYKPERVVVDIAFDPRDRRS